MPFTSFQFGNLHITDEELLSDLAKVPKCDAVLEPDDDPIVMLAEILKGFISQFGAPREVRVSNVIVDTRSRFLFPVSAKMMSCCNKSNGYFADSVIYYSQK